VLLFGVGVFLLGWGGPASATSPPRTSTSTSGGGHAVRLGRDRFDQADADVAAADCVGLFGWRDLQLGRQVGFRVDEIRIVVGSA